LMPAEPPHALPILLCSLQKRFGRPREDIHISSLILCPRQSILYELYPNSRTEVQLKYFLNGEANHQALQELGQDESVEENVEVEKEVWLGNVVAHPDMIINGMPVEIKTTISVQHKSRFHYEEQLKCYMAMLDFPNGRLLTISHTNKEQSFKEWDAIWMTNEERQARRKWISAEAELYRIARKQRDWKLARGVRDHKYNYWLCNTCPHKKKCWDYEDGVAQTILQSIKARDGRTQPILESKGIVQLDGAEMLAGDTHGQEDKWPEAVKG